MQKVFHPLACKRQWLHIGVTERGQSNDPDVRWNAEDLLDLCPIERADPTRAEPLLGGSKMTQSIAMPKSSTAALNPSPRCQAQPISRC